MKKQKMNAEDVSRQAYIVSIPDSMHAKINALKHHGPLWQELTFAKKIRIICEEYLKDKE